MLEKVVSNSEICKNIKCFVNFHKTCSFIVGNKNNFCYVHSQHDALDNAYYSGRYD